MNRQRVLTGVLFAILAFLVWFSSYLAATRIYQVDECQNIYMARVFATGQSGQFFTTGSLFLLGPLSWLTRGATVSADLLASARLLFLGVFWLNLILLAAVASGRLVSARGIIALAAAATLAPLWDYGFEIRHDNLILTGVLLSWWALRVRPMGVRSYVLLGALAVALMFVAVKSVVYVLPLACAALAFRPAAHRAAWWRLALAWGAGAVGALGLIRLAYGSGGLWDLYFSAFHHVVKVSAGGGAGSARSWPWSTLARLLTQTPLLLALAAAACAAFAIELRRRGRAVLTWDGLLPEVLLAAGALAALMANPTPFPYNLLHVVPFIFVLVFRYTAGLWDAFGGASSAHWSRLWPISGGVLLFAHVLPFGMVTQRHLEFLNFRQESLMRLAEQVTDPAKDRVYDGIGMVPTRSSIDFQWYLHSLNIDSFTKGPGPRVHDMLAARPAAVFIPNYRTDWLTDEDQAFIRERYVALSDDFWVLGKMLPAGGGTFEVIHPGRYRIASQDGSDLIGTYPESWRGLLVKPEEGSLTGKLDGKPLPSRPVELAVGTHRIETSTDCQPAIFWVGPRLDRLPRMGRGDHQWLFVNWY
jgi:hypothetical protein